MDMLYRFWRQAHPTTRMVLSLSVAVMAAVAIISIAEAL